MFFIMYEIKLLGVILFKSTKKYDKKKKKGTKKPTHICCNLKVR